MNLNIKKLVRNRIKDMRKVAANTPFPKQLSPFVKRWQEGLFQQSGTSLSKQDTSIVAEKGLIRLNVMLV
jgi:hypothetical protein